MRSKSMLLGGIVCALVFLFLVSGKSFAQTQHKWEMSNKSDSGSGIFPGGGIARKWSNGFLGNGASFTSGGWLNLTGQSAYMQVPVPEHTDVPLPFPSAYRYPHYWGDFIYTAKFYVSAIQLSSNLDADVIVEIGKGLTPIFLMRKSDTGKICTNNCVYVGTLIDRTVKTGDPEGNLKKAVFADTCEVKVGDTVYANASVDRDGCTNTNSYECSFTHTGYVKIKVDVYRNGSFNCGETDSKYIGNIPAVGEYIDGTLPNKFFRIGWGPSGQYDFNGYIDYVRYGW